MDTKYLDEVLKWDLSVVEDENCPDYPKYVKLARTELDELKELAKEPVSAWIAKLSGDNANLRAQLAEQRNALKELENAAATYRHNHDLFGDGSIEAGRAWDKMRHSEERARSILEKAVS